MNTVTKILFTRSFLFVFCQSFKVIPDVFEVFACKLFHYEVGECPYQSTQIINIVINISHLFLIINSSVNVILYIFYGKRFHQSLKQVGIFQKKDMQLSSLIQKLSRILRSIFNELFLTIIFP